VVFHLMQYNNLLLLSEANLNCAECSSVRVLNTFQLALEFRPACSNSACSHFTQQSCACAQANFGLILVKLALHQNLG